MNRENIRKVRDRIALLQGTDLFDMRTYLGTRDQDGSVESADGEDEEAHTTIEKLREGDCNSCACIAGWVVTTLLPKGEHIRYSEISDRAAELLGLNFMAAAHLFVPSSVCAKEGETWNPFEASPAQAVKVLDHLLKTGEVKWAAALENNNV